jgi:putative acetyltransferase
MVDYREILIDDNLELGQLMEEVLREFDAVEGQSMLGDPTLFKMYEQYQEKKSIYFIAEEDGEILGGCGIKVVPKQKDDNICELQRMYLRKRARGRKIGKTLIEMCIEKAREFKFQKMYIESYPQMKDAINLYTKNGFYPIPYPIGDTGHSSCDVRMLKDL